jgi:hypothetical protein
MRKVTAMSWVGALVLAALCAAPSASPIAATEQQAAQAPASSAEPADPRGTKDLPLLVETIEGADAAAERKDAAKHRAGEATRTLWMVLLAGGALLVAVIQALLFRSQLAMMKKELAGADASARVARAAAEASVASGDALRAAQRAWVAAVTFETLRAHDVITEFDPAGDPLPVPPKSGVVLSIKWVNAGQTPALSLTSVNMGITQVPPKPDQLPHFPFHEQAKPHSATLVPHASFSTGGYFIEDATIALLRDEQCQVYLYGQVEYKTIFDQQGTRRSTILYQIIFNGYLNNDQNRPSFQSRTVGHNNIAT